MEDRYAQAMEQADRVLQNVAGRAERAMSALASRTPEARAAARRAKQRRNREIAKRFKRIVAALVAIFLAMAVWGIVAPIGIGGVMIALMLAVLATVLLTVYPKARLPTEAVAKLPIGEVVHRLDTLLIRERAALPSRALKQVDAISTQLPMLESRLQTLDALDPLAQDARRLMGEHLPSLIERYEKVPPAYRQQRDAEGMSIEDRLMSGLGAARTAIDEMGQKLAASDVSAFETQGRFIESKYRDGQL